MVNAADTNQHMERIYSSVAHGEIPWNREELPTLLVELIDDGRLAPCRGLDIGCGLGNYTFQLQERGFEMTGVDVAPSAVAAAEERARAKGMEVVLQVADMTADVSGLAGPYDFVLEWMVLHHILPVDRPAYLANVIKLLRPGGLYLSVSFSEENHGFGEPPSGKWRKSPMGPTIYCDNLTELADFFAPHCTFIDKQLIEIPGKKAPHRVNYLLMRKK